MTLLIACLLIYGLNLSWWLYPVAIAVWVARTIWNMRGEDSLRQSINSSR